MREGHSGYCMSICEIVCMCGSVCVWCVCREREKESEVDHFGFREVLGPKRKGGG